MRSGLASQRHAGASAARACGRAARRRNGPGFWSSRRVAVHRHQPQHTPRQPALPLSHVRRRDTPRRWTTGGAGPVLPRRPRLPLEQWLGLRPAEQHGGPASPLRVAMHAAGHQVRRRPGPPPPRRVFERRHTRAAAQTDTTVPSLRRGRPRALAQSTHSDDQARPDRPRRGPRLQLRCAARRLLRSFVPVSSRKAKGMSLSASAAS